ncbi:MAG: DUF2795 domain-containing protein [Wenzhouxiangellaceae bacterium]|nr:DUF2795 domain-containing protein [Wenzhouxiangellaceae bacterium]
MSAILESGSIVYMYRPRVATDSPDEVQRFYILLRNSRRFRLLVVGANRLPAGESRGKPGGRNWALVRSVTGDAGEIARILRGGEYETGTQGTRHLPPVAPLGEGRYALMQFDDSTQLVHALDRFTEGDFVSSLGLRKKGFFVVAVRNPEVEVEGFPDEDPGYPESLASLFRGRRWLPVSNPGLLNHVGVQIALMAGFEVDTGALSEVDSYRLDELLDLDVPRSALETGEAPDRDAFDRRHHEPIHVDFSAGSKAGGRAAAVASGSASAVGTLLTGVSFPASKKDVLDCAEVNRSRLEDAGPAIARLERLPRETFEDMPELQQALSDAADRERYQCEVCGRAFDQRSAYRRHRETSHPARAVSAADLERSVRYATFPAAPEDLIKQARSNDAGDQIIRVIKELPEREFHDAAELAKAFQEAITGIDRSAEPPPSQRSARGASAAALAHALKGIALPARRDALLQRARDNNAPDELVSRIEAMPERRYRDFADIEQGFSET